MAARSRRWLGSVGGFRAWTWPVLSDRERVDLLGELERVKGAASAVQARATDALRCSREVVDARDVARSVGSVVALARRESPSLGDRFVGLARALVHEMPATMAALGAGVCSERVAVAVVQATAHAERGGPGCGGCPGRAVAGPVGGQAGRCGRGAGRGRAGRRLGGSADGGGGEESAGQCAAGPGRDGVPERARPAQGCGRGVRGGPGPLPGGGQWPVCRGGSARSGGGCGRRGHRAAGAVRAGDRSAAAGGGAPGDDRPVPAGQR